MSQDLKNCPFCGFAPTVRKLKGNREAIHCNFCYYTFPSYRADVLDHKDAAVEAWNKRQPLESAVADDTIPLPVETMAVS